VYESLEKTERAGAREARHEQSLYECLACRHPSGKRCLAPEQPDRIVIFVIDWSEEIIKKYKNKGRFEGCIASKTGGTATPR
jgi:hypothetical protein